MPQVSLLHLRAQCELIWNYSQQEMCLGHTCAQIFYF